MSDSDADSHGCGCFSVRIRRKRRETKKQKPQQDAKEQSKLEGPPTVTEYALHATKQTINILKGVAGLAPVPLVKEVLELGLKIIDTCEAVNDVQNRVAVLKDRITAFLLVIAKVAKDDSKDKEAASKLSDDLKADLLELKGCLNTITARLDTIRDQNTFLTGLLSQPNIQIINDCESHFQAEVSRFQTLRSLYAAQDLATIQQQLVKLYGITEEIALDVKDTRQKVSNIESSVNELVTMLTKTGVAGSTILARMPRSPDVFFGRDLVVQRIAEQLTCGDPKRNRVCVVGPGGMGKTSAALAIMEHTLIEQAFSAQHRFWVPCISANSPTLFLSILSKHVRAQQRTGDPLEDIISTLQETADPRIILLDNFETPWHPVEGSQSTIRLVLEALDALPHVSILVTMRSEFSPLERWRCERLSQIKPEDSRKIYTAIDASAGNYTELDQLVEALGHLPYAITLMASRGKRSLSNPRQLLKEWREVGTSMISQTEQGIDYSISLSINSKFVRSSPGALRLLQTLSMLPAGIYHEDLSSWADGWQSEAIDTLRDAALVLAREVTVEGNAKMHLFVLPVVQTYMKHRGRIPKEIEQQVLNACYQFLLDHNATIKGPNDRSFNQHAIAITSQEVNIQALLTNSIKDALVDTEPPPPPYDPPSNTITREQQLEALLAFAWHRYWTKPRPEMAEHVVALAKKFKNRRYEAAGLFCLGSIFWVLSKFGDASRTFADARGLFEDLNDDLMALRSECMEIDSHAQVGNFDHAGYRITECQAQWSDRLSKQPELRPFFLYHQGQINWYSNEGEEIVITRLSEAKQLFGQLHPPRRLEMALSDYYLARTYATQQAAEAAIEAINSAILGFKALYGHGLIGQEWVFSHLIKARILKMADRWDAELDDTLKIALEFFQELGLSRQIAQTLEELAETYVRKKDWLAAKLAYEEAIRKCTGLEDYTSRMVIEEAQDNLQYVAQVSEEPSRADGEGYWSGVTFRPPFRA